MKLQHEIAEKFLAKLAQTNAMDSDRIDQLRRLLADRSKKVKADDLVRIFSQSGGDNLK